MTEQEINDIVTGNWTPGQIAAFERAHEKASCEAEPMIDIDTGRVMGYWSRGWHSGADLLQAARWYSGDEISFDPAKVRQTYYRQVPFNIDGVWESKFIEETGPGRGILPVTIYEGDITG